jgi:hypothetical protein
LTDAKRAQVMVHDGAFTQTLGSYMFRSVYAAVVASLFAAACASSPAGGASATQAPRPRSQYNRITEEELAKIDVENALQAVQRLRPNFLQSHGGETTSITQGPQYVVVYVDQTRMGGTSALAEIPITEVKEIQYLTGPEATLRFGTGHTAGAIIVIRK